MSVILLGGAHDGTTLTLPENQWEYVIANPRDYVLDFMIATSKQAAQELSCTTPATYYRWTGSIRDDGTRVFRVIM